MKYTSNCKPVTDKVCAPITYQECHDVPHEKCWPKEKQIPWQKRIHKKKCLLPEGYAVEGDVILRVSIGPGSCTQIIFNLTISFRLRSLIPITKKLGCKYLSCI